MRRLPLAVMVPACLLTAAALTACGGPSTIPTGLASTAKVSPTAGSDGASAVTSPSPTKSAKATKSPKPSATPEPTPEPTASPEPTVTETPEPRPTADDGALDPVWYPHWTKSGGKGDPEAWPAAWPKPRIVQPTGSGPLDGRIVLVDPGHNLGNSTHTSQINKQYWVGLTKICNTTGTETNGGYAEASYTYDVAQRLTKGLTALGATVVLTRNVNNESTYGPCIQGRGLLGGQVGADLGVSIHADGGPASGRGAFVYTPAELEGYTSAQKAAESAQLAGAVLAGLASQDLPGSTYLKPNIAPDREQGTLNTATIPMVIVETLNMRNANDAAIAESEEGRQRVADGLLAGIRRYLGA